MKQKKIQDNLDSISKTSKELIENMRELVWTMNPDNNTLDNLVSRLREYAGDFFDELPIKTHLHFPLEIVPVKISQEVHRNIFQSYKEAINNCIKHANASQITITIVASPEIFSITISDDGNGFNSTSSAKKGNGLRNMQARIQMTGGQFEISSSSQGTNVAFIFQMENIRIKNN